MKKILAVAFALLLVVTTNLVAFAAGGSFVNSPSAQAAPILVEAENKTETCEAFVIVTAYSDRKTLDEEAQNKLLDAYEAIAATADLGTLSADVAAVADKLGIPSSELAVSELFDISYSNCEPHETHLGFAITIKPTSVENFAAILHYDGTEWEVIEGVVADDEIVFFAETLSPFAIMVHTGTVVQPSTVVWPWILAVLLLLLIVALIAWLMSKKKKAQSREKQ